MISFFIIMVAVIAFTRFSNSLCQHGDYVFFLV